MDDKKIIELYFARSQEALREVGEKYGPYCRAIARNVLGSDQEAETCAADALQRSWEAIPPQRPGHLSVFLGKITRDLALDRWADYRGKKRSDGEVLQVLSELAECTAGEEPEQSAEKKALAEAIAAYLRTQPMLRRMVFIRRYWYCNTVPVIARQLSMAEERVKSTLQQMRRELKAHLRQAVGGEALLRAMNDLPEDLIAEGNVRRRHPLIRIAAVAVCVLLLVSGLYPYFRGHGEDLPAEGVTVNGAMYEIWAPGSTAARQTGLPDRIGEDMVGLQVEEIGQGTVHLYLPAENQRAVYLLRQEDGSLRYLIFNGYYLPGGDGNAHVEADQMFLTYGVTKPEDLVSVTWGEEAVTDRAVLDAVYEALTASEAFGEEEFSQEPDDGREGTAVWIEAANGLRWSGIYSETTGVLSWCGSCYMVGEDPLAP